MTKLSETDPETVQKAEPRAEAHVEQALEICQDEDAIYHLREALHLLAAADESADELSPE